MRHFLTLPFAVCLAAHCFLLTLVSSLHTSQLFLANHNVQITEKTPLHTSFDLFVDRLMQEWHIPGLAIAVVHENKTWSKVIVSCVQKTILLRILSSISCSRCIPLIS